MIAVEVRRFFGHRLVTDPVTLNDRCLGCAWDGTGQIAECRPGTPRCERPGCANPADVTEFLGGERLDHCASCRNSDWQAR